MIIMAEGDSGVILMSEAPKSHNGSAILDVAAGITSDSDSESVSTLTTRSYLSAAGTKRNKRKNFKPRNIAYSETELISESFSNRDRITSSDSSESDYALDLSNADLIRGMSGGGHSGGKGARGGGFGDQAVARLAVEKGEQSRRGERKMCKEENDESDEPMESSPMDLTCSKNTAPFLYGQMRATNSGCSEESDSDGSGGGGGDDEKGAGGGGGRRCVKKTRKETLTEPTSKSSIVPPYSLHSIVGHSGDASDMKEYYQNTVKELLEIYGLNSDTVTDVAQTITSNVPISNFSSGKILESFTSMNDRGTSFLLKSRTSPKSEPSSPPGSPNSLCATNRVNLTTNLTSKPRTDQSFPKQIGSRNQSPIFSTTSGMVLPHNMATILAVASMKEQLKLNNSNSLEVSPSVTITPSRLSPNLNAENSNNSNSGSLTIRKVSSVSPTPTSKENRPQSISASLQQSVSSHPVDYSRYVKRYSTAMDCGSSYCKNLNYREHFHCLDCNSRVFIKKEEMIRHFKWHKKRDESLQHGFMRYSPSDDCSDRFPNCTHNRKQTHYHCIQYVAQGSCDKVYISTSDVQMHANYHRKDSAIIQEGFQRLRATEECRTSYCTFFGQRTTHFHCRREHCQYTFKNKADMEKHKTYHIKDEQLAKDGFKKFLKPDPCGFAGCRFSQVCNHIHCVREGCSYVLHSSGQLLSHKRKHERKDTEIAYRKFKLTQQNLGAFNGTEQLFQQSQINPAGSLNSSYSAMQDNNYSNSSSEGPSSPANSNKFRSNSIQLSGGYFTENFNPMDFSQSEESSDYCYRYVSHFSANDSCPPNSKCLMHGTDHYHCKEANCDLSFKTKEVAESHARQHETEERLSEKVYQDYCQEENCTREKHYHCTWDGCYDAVLPSERLDHLRTHEISASQMNSLDALFRRKRGRPPKNRVIEVWNDYSGLSGSDSPQAIFTSFKLPKPSSGGSFANSSSHHSDNEMGSSPPPPPAGGGRVDSPKHHHISQYALDQYKFEAYTDDCPDPLCTYSSTVASHYHCKRPRCYFATTAADTDEPLSVHADDFHENVDIMDGFLCFDSSVHCRRENCRSNKVKRHFHCVRPGCEFSFEHYPMMLEHDKKHHQSAEIAAKNFKVDQDTDMKREPLSPSSSNTGGSGTNTHFILTPTDAASMNKSANVVKASGTFYPLCGLTNTRSSSPTCNNDEKCKFESPSPSQTESLALGASAKTPSLLNLLPEDWLQTHTQVKYTTEKPCSRPFCKLKRKDHYHCNMCNQAFSELDKLKQHVVKHTASAVNPFVKTENNNNNNSNNNNNNNNNNNTENSEDVKRSAVISAAAALPLGLESPYQAAGFGAAMAAAQQFAMMTSQGISFIPHGMPGLYSSQSGLMFGPAHAFAHPHPLVGNGLLDSLPTHPSNLTAESNTNDLTTRRSSSPLHDLSPEMKKARIQSSMRILKDEPVPDGYLRFRFNEDCHYTHCGYREHQTHFHCVRPDCGYSFCDKTRFVQHTARHERLDTLMGGDFQQYRANVSCNRRECVYTASLGSSQNKASHFHCLKCEFVCTDTNKVVAHRRQHQKLDSINAAGFEKYTPAQACSQPDTCAHSGKQTHYHCLSCQYAVLGLSQMTAHKFRHME